MRISIIKPDSTVAIDGVGFTDLNFSTVASNIHAVQFDSVTNTGHIEYNDGTANENITSISTYQSLVDAHISKKAELDAADQANADAATALQATYGWKREQEYPPAEDYLDGIVKGDQAQVDKYIADCQAVKDKYPKE